MRGRHSGLAAVAVLFAGCTAEAPIPTPGLQLWLRADAGISLSGAKVSRWADQSGNGNDAIQSDPRRQPLYVRDALNGRPIVRFDGTDDRLGLTGSTRMSRISLFMVLKSDSGSTAAELHYTLIILGDRHNDGEVFGMGTAIEYMSSKPDTLNLFVGPRSGVRAVAPNCVRYGEWKSLDVVADRSMWNTSVRVNGVRAMILTEGVNMSLSVPLGNPKANGNGGLGESDQLTGSSEIPARHAIAKYDIAEVIVYGVALGDSARATVEQYLATKYRIAPSAD